MADQDRWNEDRARRGYRAYGHARDYGSDDFERDGYGREERTFGAAEDEFAGYRYGGGGRTSGGYPGDGAYGLGAESTYSYGARSHGGERDHEGFLEKAGRKVGEFLGHRGRGPKNYTRSDDRIREDVNDRLTEDPWLDASEIEVLVKDGEVTLSGTVAARADKRRAEDLTDQVSGVRHVQNNLRATIGQIETSATTVGVEPRTTRPDDEERGTPRRTDS